MRWIPYSLCATAAVITPQAHADIYLSTEQAQQAIFPGAHLVRQPLVLSEAILKTMRNQSGVREPFKPERVWRVEGGGYFIVDEVVGKHETIKYAVGIDAHGTVKQVEIMEYNESYGYEIRNPEWRKQFIGKAANAPLKLNQDIQNISGATLSSKHITDGVKRILVLYELALRPQ